MAVKTSNWLIGGGIGLMALYLFLRPRQSALDLPDVIPGGGTNINLESPAAPNISLSIPGQQAASSGGFDLASIFALLSLSQSPAAAPAPVIVLPPVPVASAPAPAFDFAGFLASLLGSGAQLGAAVGDTAGELGLSGQTDTGATDGGPVDQVDFNRDAFIDAGGFTELELDNIFGFSSPAPAPAPTTDFNLDFEESGFFFESGVGVGDVESPLARAMRLLRTFPTTLSSDLGSIDLPNFGDVVPLNPDGTVKFGFPELINPDGLFEFPQFEAPKFEIPEFNLNPWTALKSEVNEAGQDFKVVTEGATGLAYLGSKLPVAGKILTKLPVFGIASKVFLPLTVLDLLVTGYEFYTGNNVPVLGNRELIQGILN